MRHNILKDHLNFVFQHYENPHPKEECGLFSSIAKQAFEITFANKYKTNEEQGKEA